MTDTVIAEQFHTETTTLLMPPPFVPDIMEGAETYESLSPVHVGYDSASFEWIEAGTIEVDESYQRNLNAKRVNQIARALDPDVFNVITVSKRPDGSVHCLDGQHRVAAALLANPGQRVWVPCFTYTGLTSDDEARIFFKMNRHRLAPTALDAFKARLAFNDPDVVAIKHILDDHGIEVVLGGSNGKLRFDQVIAVTELEALYNEGLLNTVLTIIDEAWAGEENAHKGIYMRGVGTFLRTFSNELSGSLGSRRLDRLITTLAALGVHGLEKTASFYRQNIGSKPSTAIARALHANFNKGLGTNSTMKLPRWGIGSTPGDED